MPVSKRLNFTEGESVMTRRNTLVGLLRASLMFVGFASSQKDRIVKHPDPAILASENVKELLLLMDPDKKGKITKLESDKFSCHINFDFV